MQRHGRPQTHSSFDHVRSEAADMFLLLFLLLFEVLFHTLSPGSAIRKTVSIFLLFPFFLVCTFVIAFFGVNDISNGGVSYLHLLAVLSPGRNVLGKEGHSQKVSLASDADARAVFKMNSLLLSKPEARFLVEGQSRKREKILLGGKYDVSHIWTISPSI